MIQARIEGHVIGETWGGGRDWMAKSFSVSLVHHKGRKLRDILQTALSGCGNFQQPVQFTEDSVLIVESIRNTGVGGVRGYVTTSRMAVICLTELPSVSDLVDHTFNVNDRQQA